MPDTPVLLVGGFNDEDRARLEAAFQVASVAGPDDIAALLEDQRAAITAIAYKTHMPIGGALVFEQSGNVIRASDRSDLKCGL